MALKVVMERDIAIVTPHGDLIGGDETAELEKAFLGLIDQGNKKLVVDLGKVEMMTSRALGALTSTNTNYKRRGGVVKLCNLDRRPKVVLVMTHVIKEFQENVYDSLEAALASF